MFISMFWQIDLELVERICLLLSLEVIFTELLTVRKSQFSIICIKELNWELYRTLEGREGKEEEGCL